MPHRHPGNSGQGSSGYFTAPPIAAPPRAEARLVERPCSTARAAKPPFLHAFPPRTFAASCRPAVLWFPTRQSVHEQRARLRRNTVGELFVAALSISPSVLPLLR